MPRGQKVLGADRALGKQGYCHGRDLHLGLICGPEGDQSLEAEGRGHTSGDSETCSL